VKSLSVMSLLLFCLYLPAQAAVDFSVAGAGNTTLGDYYEVEYVLTGDRKIKTNPRFSEFSGFEIASGPNVSSSTRIINSQVSHSRSWRFVLVPQRTGELRIEPARITVDGLSYATKPLTVKVKGQASAAAGDEPAEIFLRATVSDSTPYQGEQIIYQLKVYFRVNVQNYTPEAFQRTAGFIVEEFPLSRQPEIRQETIDGTQYNVALIRMLALFPTQTGILEIPPSATSFDVVKRRRSKRQSDIFDQFFSSGMMENYSEQRRLTTRKITLDVQPLPEPAPDDFSGMVGSFSLKTSIDRTVLETNEPLSFTATVKGRGNIKLIPEFQLQLPHDIETYPPEVESDINRRDQVSGFKRFTYLLIPRHPGQQVFKPLHFSYFDPVAQRYVTLESDPIQLDVERSDDYRPGGSILRSGEPIQTYGVDIEYVHTDSGELKRAGECFITTWYFYLLLLVPWTIPLTAWGRHRYQDSLQHNQNTRRRRRARSNAQQLLRKARQSLKHQQEVEFYSLISQTLVNYLADKRGTAAAGLVWEDEIERLALQNIDEKLLTELSGLRQQCDFARFADTADLTAGSDLLERTGSALNQLERRL
jgi:hypothetical protein